jgi:pSer/pThr/pTyr-binding forkhead associated (FHA) protein
MFPDDDDPAKTELDDGSGPLPRRFLDTDEPKYVDSGAETLFSLKVESVNTGRREHRLRQGANSVGRDAANDIVLNHESVSRNHAVITVESKVVSVRDLESKNGTYLNNQRIRYEVEMMSGAEIRFGKVGAVLKRKTAE